LQDVTLTRGVSVVAARPRGAALALSLSDGTEREVDHVLLATGYKVDVSRYPFLSPELLADVQRVDGFPRLSSSFESSARGLYFIGAPAMWTFGPLMQFVAGAQFAAPRVARAMHIREGR
jgi:hypothetical protein